MSLGVSPYALGVGGTNAKCQRRSRDHEAVVGIGNVVNFINLSLDGGRGLLEEVEIIGKDFDLDGLGGADEVTDEVAEHAVKVWIDLRLKVFDFFAQLCHHIFGAALGVGVQLDEEIAGVGFREFKAEGDAGAAGEALDFRRGLEHFFDFVEGSIAFGEAGAGGVDDVIQHKAVLFERGEKFGFKAPVEIEAGDREEETDAHGDEAVAEGGAHGEFVESGDAAQNWTAEFRVVIRRAGFRLDDQRREGGGERDGKDERRQKRNRHRDRECAEKYAGDAIEKCQWNENDDGSKCGTCQRQEYFSDGDLHGLNARKPGCHFGMDRFDDHDGVINHQSDRRRDAAEGHQVKAHVGEAHCDQRDKDCDGDNDDRHQRGPPVLEKDEEDRDGEDEAEDDRLPHAVNRIADEEGLIVEEGEFHVGREEGFEVEEFGVELMGDVERAAIGLAADHDEHRGVAVGRDDGAGGFGGPRDAREVANADRMIQIHPDDHLFDFRNAVHAAIDERQIERVLFLMQSARRDEVAFDDRIRNLVQRQVLRVEAQRIGDDVEFGFAAADEIDARRRGCGESTA